MRISCKASTAKIVVVTLKLISALLNGALEIFLGWS